MSDDKILKSVGKIKKEADKIEEEIEDKEVETRGDPVVRFKE
ncbi:hypothetical protein LCGC14_1900650 [marine sediment metagenome]|uniref:Uncharacterized protein n=1 Tax=marine sediment metagenome TaxID=412755 RepID=A0A0F9FWR4_9ZZZZ